MPLSSRDRRLLNLLQADFPLTSEPYADLGRRLGTDADEVIQVIRQLRQKKIVRLIGPVMDSRSLGYQTTLVAMRVPETSLRQAEDVIAIHPGVSHGYIRDHHLNTWFTLAVPREALLESELQRLTTEAGAEVAFSLPATRVFKIGAYFDMDEEGGSPPRLPMGGTLAKPVDLSPTERLIINELQRDLPLTPRPFNVMTQRIGMDIDQFLGQCLSLQQKGIIRRFSACINHTRAGFVANAMACWVAPPDATVAAGRKLASLKEVSHCYERKTNPLWRHNLFAMIHGRSREQCQMTAGSVTRETGLADCMLLYSTREFKKTRVRYLV